MVTSSQTDSARVTALGCDNPALMPAARTLAEAHQLSLTVLDQTQSQLMLTEDGLSLNLPATGKPLLIDFTAGKLAHRRQFGGGRGQPLAKAVGLKAGQNPHVIDATAGLGRDAFVLATLGCQVDLLEQHPILAALLNDARQRAADTADTAEIAARMQVLAGNSLDYLSALSPTEFPDVIYLDPMYPARDKKALVKKDMQMLHQLIGNDQNGNALLRLSLEKCRKRVVVKRPARAANLADLKADFILNSKNTRYDVYLSRYSESVT